MSSRPLGNRSQRYRGCVLTEDLDTLSDNTWDCKYHVVCRFCDNFPVPAICGRGGIACRQGVM
jgi:hypothetical protein